MKRGFTLIELIGIIVILGIISIFAIPSTLKSIEIKKQEKYNKIIEDFKYAAQTYIQLNGEVDEIMISKLAEYEYIDKKNINPLTNEEMNGCIKITLKNGYREYTYSESCNG